MPQRTNQFQELVHLIELAFAGPGDTVTASAMESGQGLQTEREIDIRRETSNGLYKIRPPDMGGSRGERFLALDGQPDPQPTSGVVNFFRVQFST
jgi:hypothetical protein